MSVNKSTSFRSGLMACVPELPTLLFIFLGYGMASQVAGVPVAPFAMQGRLKIEGKPLKFLIYTSIAIAAGIVGKSLFPAGAPLDMSALAK